MPGLSAVSLEEIARSGNASREIARRHRCKAELVLRPAERVTKAIGPFGPARGKVPLLLAVARGGPRLSDQVDSGASVGRSHGQFANRAIQRIVARHLVEVKPVA